MEAKTLAPNPRKKASTAKKIFLIFIALLAVVSLAFLVIVLRPANVEIYTNTDEISETVRSLQPRVIELDHISIKAEPDSTSCGITTVAVMSNFFNNTDYEPSDLMEKYHSKGNTDFLELLQKELPGRTVVFHSNGTDAEMLQDIHASLNNNKPVFILFAAPNPYNEPYYDSHGSVVYGINLDHETVTIANSYGYREEISFVDFLNRMSFTERDKFSFMQQLIWKISPPDKNMYILIE